MPTTSDQDGVQMPDRPSSPVEEIRPDQGGSASARRVKARIADSRQRIDTLRDWVETTFLWRIWERLLENEFVDRSVALGAKAFVSFFPLIIVVGAFVPPRV